ncbi:MAG: SPOR domain-containing protein [Vicingaceae bacterium]
MDISIAIRHLLYRYDCVVIPGLGAFVGNYEAAHIHPVQHKFYPPGKRISFNRLLVSNDGLLAQHIALHSGTSFELALKMIDQEVVAWKKILKEGRSVNLEGVGTFSSNREGHLVFEVEKGVNYLLDSFGLTVFQSLPVQKKLELKVVQSTRKDLPVTEKGRTFSWDKLANYSSAAAVISIIALTTLKLDLIDSRQLARIGMNVFNKETSLYAPFEYPVTRESEITPENISQEIERSTADFINYSLAGENLVVKLRDNVKLEMNSLGPYHVVAGCFGVEDNARKLHKKLKKKGFAANMPGLHKGLNVVSYGSYSSKDEAQELLRRVKSVENPQAWLLKK